MKNTATVTISQLIAAFNAIDPAYEFHTVETFHGGRPAIVFYDGGERVADITTVDGKVEMWGYHLGDGENDDGIRHFPTIVEYVMAVLNMYQ